MSVTQWIGRLAGIGATVNEQAAIQASYYADTVLVQAALDTLIAGIGDGDLLVMLNTWRTAGAPFHAGYPGGGLPFGTGVAVLSGNPADDVYAIGAGTGVHVGSPSAPTGPGGAFMAASGTAVTLPLPNAGNNFLYGMLLTGNCVATMPTFVAAQIGTLVMIRAQQDATGNRTLGFAGSPPVIEPGVGLNIETPPNADNWMLAIAGADNAGTLTWYVFPITSSIVAVVGTTLQANGIGGLAKGRFVGFTAGSGAPVTGTWSVGDWTIDSAAIVYVCTAGGTPGTWVHVAAAGTTITKTKLTSSNAAWPIPAGAVTMDIELVGGGGSGGGAASSSTGIATAGGGGGGAGTTSKQTVAVGANTTLNYTQGAGGAQAAGGVAGGNGGTIGNAGADSTITATGISITAKGGAGGKNGAANGNGNVGGGMTGGADQNGQGSTGASPAPGQGGANAASGVAFSEGGSPFERSGGGGGGGASSSTTNGGNGAAAGTLLVGGARATGTQGGTTGGAGSDAAANTGAGGGGGGGGTNNTGAGGVGGAGGSGVAYITTYNI